MNSAAESAWPLGWVHKYETTHSANAAWSSAEVGEPVRVPGDRSHRFELRYGDVGEQDRSRSGYAWERSEMAQAGRLQRAGEAWWYAWSFAVPADFPEAAAVPDTSLATHLAQFHQRPGPGRDNWDPPWMFSKRNGGPLCLRSFPKQDGPTWPLLDDKAFRGVWHDVLVRARWSGADDGRLVVWVNGVEKVRYAGPTCAADGGEVYHKYGLYRVSDAGNRNAVAWFSQLRRGRSREEVDIGHLPRPPLADAGHVPAAGELGGPG